MCRCWILNGKWILKKKNCFKLLHFTTLLVLCIFLATTIWRGCAFPVTAKGHRQNVSDKLVHANGSRPSSLTSKVLSLHSFNLNPWKSLSLLRSVKGLSASDCLSLSSSFTLWWHRCISLLSAVEFRWLWPMNDKGNGNLIFHWKTHPIAHHLSTADSEVYFLYLWPPLPV